MESEKKDCGKKREGILDDSQLCSLRKIIYKIYTVDKEIPSLNRILCDARQQINYQGSKTLLRKLLSEKLTYKFKKCKNNGPMPIERHKTAYNRINFISQLLNNHSCLSDKRPTVYIDEISFNHMKAGSGDNIDETWYLFYAGGDESFIEGSKLLLKQPTKKGKVPRNISKQLFLNWLKDILIPSLLPNSIVILDDAPQHNKLIEIIPNELSSKQQIQTWLENHKIEFKKDFIHAELFKLVKKNMPRNNYVADELIEAAGHTVLRLPIYTDLNPMANILHRVKKEVTKKSLEQLGTPYEDIIKEVLASITKEDWLKEINQLKNLLNEYYENENLLDKETDELAISFEESEGDMFSSDTDDYNTDFSYDTSDISESYDSSEEEEWTSDDTDYENDHSRNC